MAGKIFLIPVTLGGEDFRKVIPDEVLSITKSLKYFAVEDLRSARRFLKLIDRDFPVNETVFFELNEHTEESEISHFIKPVIDGNDLGIMSEAGLPGIADPGSRLVYLAHRNGIRVIPLSGPSSIIMALVASGLNGQNFAFNGYLPVKPAERTARLQALEKKCLEGYPQIFMETPYRNQRMLQAIIEACRNDTKLCIAADITLKSENIRTMKISEWKKNMPEVNNRQVIFILA